MTPTTSAPLLHIEMSRELARGVKNRTFAGAVCLMQQGGGPMQFATAGLRLTQPREPIGINALFDVGPLTSSLVVAPLVAWLLSHNRLDLDAKLKLFLPELTGTAWGLMPIGALLEQQGGLSEMPELFSALAQGAAHLIPAVRLGGGPAAPRPVPLAAAADTAKTRIVEALMEGRPAYPIRQEAHFSPVSSLLLGLALEALGKKSLADLVTATLLTPLGLTQDMVCARAGAPLPPAMQKRVVAGEFCSFRKRQVTGEPRDACAYAMGGFYGHGGLFCSAPGALRMLSSLRGAYQVEPSAKFFQSSILRKMWTRSPRLVDAPWALGWEAMGRGGPLGQGRWHPSAVGHVDFASGSGYLIDPHYGVCCVLLTHQGGLSPTAPFALSSERKEEARHALLRAFESAFALRK